MTRLLKLALLSLALLSAAPEIGTPTADAAPVAAARRNSAQFNRGPRRNGQRPRRPNRPRRPRRGILGRLLGR